MIKKIAYSVVLGGMLAGLGACSAEPDYVNGAIAQNGELCSFAKNQLNTSMLPGSSSFEIEVYRVGTQGDETVPVTIEEVPNSGMTTEGLTCSSAVFTNGSSKAVVTLTIENAMPPTIYGGNLKIGNKSAAGYSTMSFRIPVEYEWEDMEGTGWIRLPNFIWFSDWVEVGNWQKAKGFDRWRVVKPMTTVYAEYFPDSPTAGLCWGWDGWSYDINDAGNFEFYTVGNNQLTFEPFCLGMKFGGSSVGYYLPTNYKGSINGTDYDYSENSLDGTYWAQPLYGICAGIPTGSSIFTDLIEFTMPGYGE